MSARSPRSSISGPSSAEVAEDFAESLKDLQINNRYEITNLTIIAKENTEHAQAISKALETHIKTTAPSRKLPALYVLDSIVKNVGAPYTGYLGSNLYRTFMEAYTLVDSATRRSMEGVLKTWKEPITGSIDPRPVFSPEIVRPIENALIKAKTMALQSQRHIPQQAYQNTPTPPQHGAFAAPPPGHGQQQPFYPQGAPQVRLPLIYTFSSPTPNTSYQQSSSTPQFQSMPLEQQFQYRPPSQQPPNDVEAIKRDIAALVAKSREQFSNNPFDQQLQARLQALLMLEDVLNRRALSDVELQNVRNQLSAMSAGSSALAAARPTPPPQSSSSQWQPPPMAPQVQPQYAPSSSAQSPAAAPFLAPGALNSLQALLANNQKPGTPQMRAAAPALQGASHAQLQNVQNQTAAAPSLNGVDLVAALSKNGLIPAPPASSATQTSSTPAQAPLPPPSGQSTADLLRSLQGKIAPMTSIQPIPSTSTPTLPIGSTPNQSSTSAGKPPRMPMTSASLKTFQPSLIHALYESHPNQCSTCGRRFAATETGRQKKSRHLDWHFRTNQRLADAGRSAYGAQHRLFYPDEYPWVQHRDFDVSTTDAATAAAAATAGGGADGTFSGNAQFRSNNSGGGDGGSGGGPKRPEDESVPAPPGVTKNTCRICFEDMKSAFNSDRQAWVFMNAKRSGGGIVHATCLAELQKPAGGGIGLSGAGGGGGLSSLLSGAGGSTAVGTGTNAGAGAGAGSSSLAAVMAAVNANSAKARRSATPESTSSLGKRKAESGSLVNGGAAARLKTE